MHRSFSKYFHRRLVCLSKVVTSAPPCALEAGHAVLCRAHLGRRSLQTLPLSEERLNEFLKAEASYFASQDPTSISIKMIIDASTPDLVADLALRELPVRYAHRIQQIEHLPGWTTSPDIVEVHGLYSAAFRDLRLTEFEPGDDLTEFTETIQVLKKRFRMVIPRLATGMRFLQQTQNFSEAFIQEWLDTFLLSRIGTEMLTSQYIATMKSVSGGRGQPSIVNPACDPAAICEQAAKHARKLCKQHFFLKESVQIFVETEVSPAMADGQGRIRFSYVPQYLFYVMLELLKNSARATVENSANANALHEKPIIITVGADESQVVIRLSDRANGIPFSVADKVWSYMYSTAPKNTTGDFTSEGTPLAGYGVGLPLSKLYARYLGGSLSLMSMPGIGTNGYLYLKRIDTEAREDVPRSSLSSLGSLSEPMF